MPTRRPCPICSCLDVVPVNGGRAFPHGMEADICTNCGLVYTNPMYTDEEKDQKSPDHRLLHRSRSREMASARAFYHSLNRMLRTWNALSAHVEPGQEVLEVASGDGALLHLLKQAGADPMGIDKDYEAARSAARRVGVPVASNAFEEHDFGCQKFDLVVLCHCIEHFYDPVAILRRVHSLLRPHGTVFLETPNILRPKVGPKRVFSFAHNYHFSPRTLSLALHLAGFEVVRTREYGSDVFQLAAVAVSPQEQGRAPAAESWQEVARRIDSYRRRYYTSFQFLWRKLPILGSQVMNRVVSDVATPDLTHLGGTSAAVAGIHAPAGTTGLAPG